MRLSVYRCGIEDLLTYLGPLAREHLRREQGHRARLGLSMKCYPNPISIDGSAIDHRSDGDGRSTFATSAANLRPGVSYAVVVQLSANLMSCLSVENVVHFGGDMSMDVVKEIVPAMARIEDIHLIRAQLEPGFLLPDIGSPGGDGKLLPSLQRIRLEDVLTDEGSWQPLLSYLAHQTTNGQKVWLTISAPREHICEDVLKEIQEMVEDLVVDIEVDAECPFDSCG